MSEWILILTMVMSQDFGSALETQVFTSENSCVATGQAWVQQVRERMQGDTDDVAKYLCMPR